MLFLYSACCLHLCMSTHFSFSPIHHCQPNGKSVETPTPAQTSRVTLTRAHSLSSPAGKHPRALTSIEHWKDKIQPKGTGKSPNGAMMIKDCWCTLFFTAEVTRFCPQTCTVPLEPCNHPGSLHIAVLCSKPHPQVSSSGCVMRYWMKNRSNKFQAQWRKSLFIYEPKSNL